MSSEEIQQVAPDAELAEEVPDLKRVFVGNLPFKLSYKELEEFFSDFNLIRLTIPRKRQTGKDGQTFMRKQGFAFAELGSKEDAQRAVEKLDNQIIKERTLSVRLASGVERPRKTRTKSKSSNGGESSGEGGTETSESTPVKEKKAPRVRKPREKIDSEKTVFVGNLPADTTKEDVTELFGELVPVNVKLTVKKPRLTRSKETAPGYAYALVTLADHESQEKAIELLDSKVVKENEIKVKIAVEKDKPDTSSEDKTELNGESTGEVAEAAESAEVATEEPNVAESTEEPATE